MKVLKFGGSSVGSAQGLRQVRRIVAANDGQIVVVVSALGGITDRLLATAAAAAAGKPDYTDSLAEIVARHRTTIDETVASGLRGAIRRRTDELLDELANILRGVYLIRDLSPRTGDAIVSYGERLSSGIVAAVLEGSRLYDAREFIRTKTDFGKHIAEPDLTEKLIRERLADRPRVSVVPGFIASDCATGDVTNLGRGGSDYTAALIAAALNAETLEIWTDVDGFMTADPRVISDAYVIDRLSFEEAMELCNFGAKVVYPPTIFPVYHRDIPILIKNTFNPEAPGTFISRERVQGRDKAIKGISSINNTCLVTIQGLGMVGVIGVNHRIFRTLARAGISVFFVSQAASENTTSIGLRNEDADLAIAMLTREFAPEIEIGEVGSITAEHDLATIAVVGDDMKHTPGIAGKLFGTLGRNGINVIACTQGASETNISVVVTLESLPKAINVIHDSFFLSEYQVLNIFVAGVGQVGRDLLEQIRLQRRTLMADNGLQIRVVGIANSRKRLIDAEGIALNDCLRRLEEEGTPSTPESLRDEILALNIYNSVFVACILASENLIFNQHFDDMEAYNACLHPFIRNTIGCMEFGGTLLNKRHNRTNDGGTIRKTTDVFQLATAVLYQNPIQNFALAPNNLTDAPALAIDFMKEVPTTWDETVFLDGYPGKYCVLARRHGDRWYVVGVNAQKEPLKLSLNLPMWEKGETVSYYLDDKKRQPQLEELKIKNPAEVKVVIQPDGGIILTK